MQFPAFRFRRTQSRGDRVFQWPDSQRDRLWPLFSRLSSGSSIPYERHDTWRCGVITLLGFVYPGEARMMIVVDAWPSSRTAIFEMMIPEQAASNSRHGS